MCFIHPAKIRLSELSEGSSTVTRSDKLFLVQRANMPVT
jgi:hypothetical protein